MSVCPEGGGREAGWNCCSNFQSFIIFFFFFQVEFPEARIYEETLNILLYETPRVPDNSLLEATSQNPSQASRGEDEDGNYEPRDRVRRIHVKRYSTYDDRQIGH